MNTHTQLQFLQNHKPLLQDGEYKITVEQSLEIKGNKPEDFQPLKKTLNKTFQVAGERFQLKPQDIHGVFPPNHNLGEHSNVLPHIILNRSTLPWERKAQSDDENTPWLALLVFDQEEVAPIATSPKEDPSTLPANADKVTTKVVSLSELEADSDSSPFFPKLTLEKGQKPTDKVKVIDVPKKLLEQIMPTLEQIMPTAAELQFLTHVRQTEDDKGSVERAVIIANRLPKSGNQSVVHLVSVEDRFKDGTFNYKYKEAGTDQEKEVGPNDKIRLVTLKSWEFTCMERYRVTDEAIEHLNNMPLLKNNPTIKKITEGSIHLSTEEFFSKKEFLTELKKAYSAEDKPPSPTANGKTIQELLLKAFGFGDFASILKKLDRNPSTLRLPDTGNDVADQFLKMGYVPASHYFRKGDKAVSWYHGPLSPLENPPTELNLPLPPRASDHLLRYYQSISMLDASYAAAWELGRLLALQDKSFSTGLYRWKRCHAHQLKKEKQQFRNQDAHHPGAHQINRDAYRLPKELANWFYDLHLLKGLPFNYLVPDEAMLPSESIRFFTLDKLWIACLIDGAFSIGRVITHDHSKDENLFHAVLKKSWDKDITINLPEQNSEELKTTLSGLTTISGCLIRSEVVSGWPGLLVEASTSQVTDNGELPNPMLPIRMEKLSQNVLLVLFEGQIQTLDIHLKPETIHFGFSVDPNDSNLYHKKLRDENGEEHDDPTDQEKYTINFSVDSNTRVVKITDNAVASEATDGLVKLIQDKYNSASNKTQIAWMKREEKEVEEATSAEFALQMIEGVEKVRLVRKSPG
ncbi:MAG: hypothetical protein MGF17_00755 [Trichodesmium sp. MAG_R04]|nr:hypothetical protein [Trichodesmium sp. MAG_R04]